MLEMSTFKCGLRRFDGHGTSSYRPTNTAATKEMESAFSRMMREREQQDKGCFGIVKEEIPIVQEEKQVIKKNIKQESEEPKGNCYSLSDATPTKKTA
jgi:hypothetical protein